MVFISGLTEIVIPALDLVVAMKTGQVIPAEDGIVLCNKIAKFFYRVRRL